MRRKIACIVGFLLLVGCQGGAAGRLSVDADQFILYSLDGPAHFKSEGELTPEQQKGETLHRYPVLGKVEITDRDQRRSVVAEVNGAIRNPSGEQYKCFIPRHAIRTVRAGETIDLVICFECHNYEEFRQGIRSPGGTLDISSSAQPLLDQILTDAGVPLAPKK